MLVHAVRATASIDRDDGSACGGAALAPPLLADVFLGGTETHTLAAASQYGTAGLVQRGRTSHAWKTVLHRATPEHHGTPGQSVSWRQDGAAATFHVAQPSTSIRATTTNLIKGRVCGRFCMEGNNTNNINDTDDTVHSLRYLAIRLTGWHGRVCRGGPPKGGETDRLVVGRTLDGPAISTVCWTVPWVGLVLLL